MKKAIKMLVLFLGIIFITGCVSYSDRKDILKELTKNNVINKKWSFVDEIIEKHSGYPTIPGITTAYYNYVYKSGDTYYIIRIDANKNYNKDDDSTTYKITKYKTTSIEELIPYPDETLLGTFYKYKNNENKIAKNNIYAKDLIEEAKYELIVKPEKFLLFSWKKKELKEIN